MPTQSKIPTSTSRYFRKGPFWQLLLFEGSLGLLALFFAHLSDIHIWQNLYWRWEEALTALGITLLLFLFFLLLYHLPFSFAREIKARLAESIGPLFTHFSVTQIFLVSLMAGCGEELFFRGFLQEVVARTSNDWWGLGFSNLLFGLVHWITPFYALFAGLLGFLLGSIMLYFDNLLSPILIHSLYDFAALCYFLKKPASLFVSSKRNGSLVHTDKETDRN